MTPTDAERTVLSARRTRVMQAMGGSRLRCGTGFAGTALVTPNDRNSRTDLATVDHLLTTTRSDRERLDFTKPVDLEAVAKCIDNAIQAPTGSNARVGRCCGRS